MSKNSLKLILFLLGLLVSGKFIFANNAQTLSTTINSSELSTRYLQEKNTNNNLVAKNYQNKNANSKNNKSSSQELIGTWVATSANNNTLIFNTDGNYLHIITRSNGDWYFFSSGTWNFSGNVLSYERSETGENTEGSVKFRSKDEFVYINDNKEETEWQRVDINSKLSKEQLVGTWSIVLQDRVGDSLIDNPFARGKVKLIELNSDGTFRRKSIDGRVLVPGADIKTKSYSGTWTYINSGYADGFLLLRDSEGNLFSYSSINWKENGNFINISFSKYDRDENKLNLGRIEEFRRSDLIVD